MSEQPRLCQATKRDGAPCRVRALPGDTYCWAHSAATREKREEARTAGGKNHANVVRASKGLPQNLAFLQESLTVLFTEVKQGKVAPRVAEVMAGVARAVLEYGKFAFELHEAGELKRRLDELEARLGTGDVRAG